MPGNRTVSYRRRLISAGVVIMLFLVGWSYHQFHRRNSQRRAVSSPIVHAAVERPSLPTFTSVNGHAIDVRVFGAGAQTVLVLAGMHGDEPASVELARALGTQLQTMPAIAFTRRVLIMPAVNPDGLAEHTRRNAHKIDLNRNFPTRDFGTGAHSGRYNGGHTAASEPETQAVMQVIAYFQPAVIISIHTPLGCINYDGPAESIARRMAQLDHFPVVNQLRQRSPGSMGTYYGKERNLPVITLELTPGQPQWERHGRALLDALGITPSPVVCLDPGHPSEINAGRTVQHGITEVATNWQVTQRLVPLLKAKGITVVVTKQAEDEMVTNRQRAEIANAHHAVLFLRLHCDTGSGSGITCYYPDGVGTVQGHTGPSSHIRASSRIAALRLHQGAISVLGSSLHDNGVKGESVTTRGRLQGALTGSIFSQTPVVTVEMVYLSNEKDAAYIAGAAGQQQMAEALANGIIHYHRIRSK